MTGIMADLEDIWLNALEVEMNIQKQELGRFKVIKYPLSQCLQIISLKFNPDCIKCSQPFNFRPFA